MTGIVSRLLEHDERILNALVLRRTSAVDLLMRSVTHLGDAWLTIPAALLLAAGSIPSAGLVGQKVAFTLAVSHLWVQLWKRAVVRERPRLPVGCASLIDPPDRFSFPSGHAASSLSIALPLATLLPLPLAFCVLALSCLVGLSRCYLGVHYPGDVLIGWALAAAAALISGPVLALDFPTLF